MKSDSHIFISFKTEEQEIASKLKDALIYAGYEVWWQKEIQCGQEWHGEIDKALMEAGAVVVLWSESSLKSEWVKHEASQAIARDIYAPVRIEVVGIESPFNRIQATDLYYWNGEQNAPGFQNLLLRLSQLMPPPVPIYKRVSKFLRAQIVAIVLFIITAVALFLLISQSSLLSDQAEAQKELEKLLQKTSNNLDASTENTDRLLQETRDSINTQFQRSNLSQKRLEELTDQLNKSSSQTIENLDEAIYSLTELDSSQKQVLVNIKRNLYPLNIDKMSLSYEVWWDVESKYIQSYTNRLLQTIKQKIKGEQSIIPVSQVRERKTFEAFFEKERTRIFYSFDSDNQIKIKTVQIGSDDSGFMPDCSNFEERFVSDILLDHKLRLDFIKEDEVLHNDNEQAALELNFFTVNSYASCLKFGGNDDQPDSGDSALSMTLWFDEGPEKLMNFVVNYKTNKVISKENTGNFISILDLLNAKIKLRNLRSSEDLRPKQVNDIRISFSGDNIGGLFFNGSDFNPKSASNTDYLNRRIRKEYFDGNIFDQ